ncbi:MAG: LexA family transcriptional regulator [Paludibacteraceae bacterium]|nr:LexA family transcriptional regulator [Paludibacteraceae bacterium]
MRGGKREGAGRPKGDSKLYTFRVGGDVAAVIDAQPSKTEFIVSSIKKALRGVESLGEVSPVSSVGDLTLPFFDINLVAGFPIPLDNDELSQDIELLKMLCPHPESSYLIRVKGESMVDAGVRSGDIVIVDKSNRNPSEHEMAVCELNGEYTLKQVVEREGTMFLVPANNSFPEIEVKPADTFSVWGTVTYIIHKARL